MKIPGNRMGDPDLDADCTIAAYMEITPVVVKRSEDAYYRLGKALLAEIKAQGYSLVRTDKLRTYELEYGSQSHSELCVGYCKISGQSLKERGGHCILCGSSPAVIEKAQRQRALDD